MGFEAAGAAPIATGQPIAEPRTIASAIRIGNPASWSSAEAARDESKGVIGAVSDDDIVEAWKHLARSEGIFCEPASAASVAGLAKTVREGADFSDHTVVCVLTGSGLKDPAFAASAADTVPEQAPADLEAVASLLGLPARLSNG
jgi:threonine synthase